MLCNDGSSDTPSQRSENGRANSWTRSLGAVGQQPLSQSMILGCDCLEHSDSATLIQDVLWCLRCLDIDGRIPAQRIGDRLWSRHNPNPVAPHRTLCSDIKPPSCLAASPLSVTVLCYTVLTPRQHQCKALLGFNDGGGQLRRVVIADLDSETTPSREGPRPSMPRSIQRPPALLMKQGE